MNGLSVPIPDPATLPTLLRDSAHWITWKAEARDGKVAKVPCDRAGHTASMKENHLSLSEAIKSAERLRKIYDNEAFGVGLSFVEGGGIVALDLDSAIVDGVRAEHLKWLIDDHPTWAEISLSGVGAHLFYAGDFDGKRIARIHGIKIEVFGTKGFVAVTGRSFPGTPDQQADFSTVADVLGPYLEKQPVKKKTTVPVGTFVRPHGNTAYGLAALEAQCSVVRAAAQGTLHYTLCSAATSLGRLVPNYLTWEEAENALYVAAEMAGGRDMDNALKTIRGQLEFGMTDPVILNGDANPTDVDLSSFGADDPEEIHTEAPPSVDDPGPFPEHLLDVPGFLGEVAAFTNQNSFVLQPILALAGALALLSVLTGRKVRDKDGIRTNLYVLSVAGSGEGKDMARKTNKRILYAAGAPHLLGPESWASGSGLLAAVEKQPAILFQNDEIGRFLQTTGDAKKAPHLFSIVSILLKLYSSADDVFLGDAYADGRQKQIPQPHAVLFGTTVPESLYAGLSEDSVTNGLMGRMLIFEAPDRQQPTQEPDTIEPPESVITTARKWAQWQVGSGNLGGIHPTTFVVPVASGADEQFRQLRAEARDRRAALGNVLGSLWVRAVENARKLALLYACSVAIGESVCVDENAAKWACDLTRHLVRRQCIASSQHIARNTTESDSLAIERMICYASPEGITAMELHTKTRHLKRRDRDEIIASLLECGKIKVSQDKTGRAGRPKSVYSKA